MSIQIEFESFCGKVGWRLTQSSRNKPQSTSESVKDTQGKDSQEEKKTEIEKKAEILAQVKELLDVYPMEFNPEKAEKI